MKDALYFLKMSRNLVVKCKALRHFVVFKYACLPSLQLHESYLRARVIFSCVSMLESGLFSQLKGELPSSLVLYFLLFLCFYLL